MTDRTHWAWVVAAAALAFAAGTWVAHRDTGETHADEVAALAVRVDALARAVDALRQAPAVHPATPPLGPRGPAGSRFPAPLAAPPAPDARVQADLQAAHVREPVDPAWAPATRQQLMEVARTEAILGIEADPPTSQRVECRSRSCRLEFEFASAADATDWMTAYLTGIGSRLSRAQYFTGPGPDGRVRVTMYGYK